MYIDTARQAIDELAPDLRKFFLAPLLYEASVHNNTSVSYTHLDVYKRQEQQLSLAVAREDYERAAKLREQIKQLRTPTN